MLNQKKYLFIDRDGTLICEPDDFQVDSLEKVKLMPNVISALLKLQAAGYQLVMVSNQDGLGQVSFPKESFERTQRFILELFESQGVFFQKILICPHFANENCECRKPKLGLVLEYLKTQVIDCQNSFVIGDRVTDMQLAENMGIKGILLDNQMMTWNGIVELVLNKEKIAKIYRKTKETDIEVIVNLNQPENCINTGIPFFDHMLNQLATHGGFGLQLKVKGDLLIDDHHTVEDTAIVLGQALYKVLGDKQGITRYGFVLPMDEALATVALDLCGRSFFAFEGEFLRDKVGALSTECVPHFFATLAQNLKAVLHIKMQGKNTHHMVESLFKAVGKSLRMAITKDANTLPSTKGSL